MKPMLPTLTFDLTIQPDWLYEVKYDGFRAILNWDKNGITLTSRNDKPLLPQFPEIKNYLESQEELFQPFLLS
jgi:bifunctional non-homologous end joining protein LigD